MRLNLERGCVRRTALLTAGSACISRPSLRSTLLPPHERWTNAHRKTAFKLLSSMQGSTPSPTGGAREGAAMDKQAIKESVERASKLLDEMLEEIMSELFVEQATAYISEEQAALTEAEAVRNAVVQRVEFLDANFLAALNGYVEVAKHQPQGEDDLLPLLELMRNEVLYQVALRLPPAARVLNTVLKEVDKDDRLGVLRTALRGGSADLPGCDADSISAASTQFIDDMEDQEVVADRRLLARLCLVREEVRWLSIESSFTGAEASSTAAAASEGDAAMSESPADVSTRGDGDEEAEGVDEEGSGPSGVAHFHRSNVPQRPAAFINQLVGVSEPAMRVGLISRAFCEDWEGAAPRQKPQSSAQKGQPDFVRPGRFMLTLHAMMQNMEGSSSSGAPGPAGASVLKRMADIQMEAVNVLDRMQRGQLKPV